MSRHRDVRNRAYSYEDEGALTSLFAYICVYYSGADCVSLILCSACD